MTRRSSSAARYWPGSKAFSCTFRFVFGLIGHVVATLAPSPMRVTARIWLVRRATLGLRR